MKKLIFAAVTVVALSSGATEYHVTTAQELYDCVTTDKTYFCSVYLGKGTYDITGIGADAAVFLPLKSRDATRLISAEPGLSREDVIIKGDGVRRFSNVNKGKITLRDLTFTNVGKEILYSHNLDGIVNVTNCCCIGNVLNAGSLFNFYNNGGQQPKEPRNFSGCCFVNNLSTNYTGGANGGAVARGVGMRFYDCVFTNNVCDWQTGVVMGGNLYQDCTFVSNKCTQAGGTGKSGVYMSCYEGAVFDGCTFEGNGIGDAVTTGFAIGLFGDSYQNALSNCIFRGNTSHGGGMMSISGKNHRVTPIVNCLFESNVIDNTSILYGGSAARKSKLTFE